MNLIFSAPTTSFGVMVRTEPVNEMKKFKAIVAHDKTAIEDDRSCQLSSHGSDIVRNSGHQGQALRRRARSTVARERAGQG